MSSEDSSGKNEWMRERIDRKVGWRRFEWGERMIDREDRQEGWAAKV